MQLFLNSRVTGECFFFFFFFFSFLFQFLFIVVYVLGWLEIWFVFVFKGSRMKPFGSRLIAYCYHWFKQFKC